ncbi:MAG TPA: BTAD domain-containing putative transcriptional regulator [Candidatus Binatia bacterium]|nr:BTAD domain-containing putative transcriptional regulator [Candidatus Binatia bacterium]
MGNLELSLFGKFTARYAGEIIRDLEARKAQELFAYLMLHRERPHTRERIATLLWNDLPDSTAKRYLSKALWQLQNALDIDQVAANDLFVIDPEWIHINSEASVHMDVAVFDATFESVKQLTGRQLDAWQIELLAQSVHLYQGELLEGWYHDWCVLERQKRHDQLLQMLDKLTDYYEASGQYENGLYYGRIVLNHDRARERTHRRLMRLYYLAGDRTGALRQYQQCATALYEELEVSPSSRTVRLHEKICAGFSPPINSNGNVGSADAHISTPTLQGTLARLHQLRNAVSEVQGRLDNEIEQLEQLLAAVRIEAHGNGERANGTVRDTAPQ